MLFSAAPLPTPLLPIPPVPTPLFPSSLNLWILIDISQGSQMWEAVCMILYYINVTESKEIIN